VKRERERNPTCYC
jgi:protein-L-isoaspartate(D-aspartate) O-methyltransferase